MTVWSNSSAVQRYLGLERQAEILTGDLMDVPAWPVADVHQGGDGVIAEIGG